MTSVYTVQGPDGKQYQLSGPDNATSDQLTQALGSHPALQGTQQAAPAQPQQAADMFTQGENIGKQRGPIAAGLDQAARQYLPFGLGNDVGAAAIYGKQALTGKPVSFKDALAASGGESQGEVEANPTSSTIGGTVGGIGQALAATKLLSFAQPFKAALALKKGATVANIAKTAAAGAVPGAILGAGTGAVQGGINNGEPSATQAVVGAAIGGATGAVEGAAGGLVGGAVIGSGSLLKSKFFGSDDQKAGALLAKTFGVSPNQLEHVASQFQLDTGGQINPQTGEVEGGRLPAMGELSDLYNRGEIHAMVGKNPKLAGAVAQAAEQNSAALPGRMNQAVTQTVGMGEDPATLVAARSNNMDKAMTPIRDQAINLDPHDVDFLRSEVLPNAGMTQLGRKGVHADLDQGQLTLGNLDTMRQSLNARASANPGEGFDQLAKGMTVMGTDASPEYQSALDQYAKDSAYINGHAHGLTGKTVGQTSDPSLIRDLGTPAGQQGYQSGIKTRLGNLAFGSESNASALAKDLSEQSETSGNLGNTLSPASVDNLRAHAAAEASANRSITSISPSNVKQQDGVNLPQAAFAAVSHTLPAKIYHGLKAGFGNGMSDQVAQVTAKYLTDPNMLQKGINLMKRHGVSEDQTRQFIAHMAAGTGAAANVAVTNGGQ